MRLRRPCRDEQGVIAIMTALMLVVFLGFGAIVVDLGRLRAERRLDQSVADLAALAAAKNLAASNPAGACRDAIGYLNANAPLTSAINATSFCSQAGNSMSSTTCSGGSLTEAMPTTTVGAYTVSIHYPVPAAEIVPVPADPLRARLRGFDPAALMAKELARRWSRPLNDCLARSHSRRQVGRSRTERMATGPSIRLLAEPPVNAVLVDDVITTGTTLAACAAALREGGCSEILALAFARA